MQAILTLGCKTYGFLDSLGQWLPQLGFRFLIAWEFWESGLEKFSGSNWFMDFRGNFPFPFNLLPSDLSWSLATWSELLGSIALALGFATRFSAFSLIIIDFVAWYSVHADNGYNVCMNGFKLPLIYLLMLIPLLTSGAGKASIDYILKQRYGQC